MKTVRFLKLLKDLRHSLLWFLIGVLWLPVWPAGMAFVGLLLLRQALLGLMGVDEWSKWR